MRNSVLSAAVLGSALSLAACSQTAEDTVPPTEEATVAPVEIAAPAETGVLDASTATADQLAAASGMTPELAQAVVDGRPYASASAFNARLMETLSETEAAAVRETVFVPVNLNSASREDIALIPGMTDRMIGEFLEYRPYADMAEFDREIGKYVDAAEVARFRKYITL